jgi:hypothetical protein
VDVFEGVAAFLCVVIDSVCAICDYAKHLLDRRSFYDGCVLKSVSNIGGN